VVAWYPDGFAAMGCCIGAVCDTGEASELVEGVGVADVKPTMPLMLAPCEAETGTGAANWVFAVVLWVEAGG
jgi:hypothetical protein